MGNPFYCGARFSLQAFLLLFLLPCFLCPPQQGWPGRGREGRDGKGRSPPPLPLSVFFAGVSILILPSRWDLVTFAPFLLFIYFPGCFSLPPFLPSHPSLPSLPLRSSGAAAGAAGGRAGMHPSPPAAAAAALAGITASPSQLPA